MSLKKNIVANYVSQIYVMLIGIVMVPVYIRYIGAEAYGLVGFYAMLQSWFMLLDMGLTPTMARATARFSGGAMDGLTLKRLVRALEGVFIGVAFIGAVIIVSGSEFISTSWLKVEELSLLEVQRSIVAMGFIVAFRWICGLYRGAVSGFERLVWLSGFNISIATARFLLVLPVLVFVGATPTHFFGYQLAIAFIELSILLWKTYRLLPTTTAGERIPLQWKPLRGVLKFSLSIAFTSSIWVLVTQTDKLILSKILSLSEYAYFTLAIVMAGGVIIASGPISAALLPRLTRLFAEGNEAGLFALYRNATQLVATIAIPACLVLAFFPDQVLWVWTGNSDIVNNSSDVLRLYALGNGFLAIAAFPYYLQYAKGELKLHIIGSSLFVTGLIPTLIWASVNYGAVGAGWAWLVSNATYFLLWVPKVHMRYAKGLHIKWIAKDVGTILFTALIGVTIANEWLIWPDSRTKNGFIVLFVGIFVVLAASVGSAFLRAQAVRQWRKRVVV